MRDEDSSSWLMRVKEEQVRGRLTGPSDATTHSCVLACALLLAQPHHAAHLPPLLSGT